MAERTTALQTSDPSDRYAASSLRLVDPQTLYERMRELNDEIAQRAFQIFEQDGGRSGRELDNWFRAESEMLHPAHVRISENEDTVTVRAEVPGFDPGELKVSLEPRRLTISGRRESSGDDRDPSTKTVYQERCSKEMLRTVELPIEVDASKTTAILRNGILELRMPKAAEAKKTQVQVKAASSSS